MIIVIASEKGGTGKTTISTNLSVLRALNQKKVLLVDSDAQQSSVDFINVRNIDNISPDITCTPVIGSHANDILLSFKDKFDDIIVDVGGRDSVTMRSVISIANVLIVPFLPGSLDAWSTEKMAKLAGECIKSVNNSLRVLCVLNKADVNPKNKDNEDIINLVNTYPSLPNICSALHYRVSYRRAIGEGRGVMEITGKNRDNKAVCEINKLYDEVFND